jgi:hypothetical protein
VEFHEASGLTPEHWRHLERTVKKRVLRAFLKRGLIEEDAVQDMLTWQASGGFSVDASVRIEGDDRIGIERLVRYCARGPLALERQHALDGTASTRCRPAERGRNLGAAFREGLAFASERQFSGPR